MDKLRRKVNRLTEFSLSSKDVTILISEIFIGIFLSAFSSYVFIKLAEKILGSEIIFFDESIIQFAYSIRSSELTTIMQAITFLGGDIFISIALVVTIFLLYKKHRKDSIVFSFIFAFGVLFNMLLKQLFQRPRPDLMPVFYELTYSFPSGHAMNSFIFYTCLSFFIFKNLKNKMWSRILMALAGVLILLIGFSRVYLGVHYPSDVVAGYAAGFFWFVFVLLFDKTLIFLRLFKKYDTEKRY